MMPTRNNAEQIASVGIMSNRVEHASASAARIHSANRISTAAGTSRQSTARGQFAAARCWLVN